MRRIFGLYMYCKSTCIFQKFFKRVWRLRVSENKITIKNVLVVIIMKMGATQLFIIYLLL